MVQVMCGVEELELETDEGQIVDGVRVTCERCDHHEDSFGTSDRSVKRCLVLLRENCPEEERNFYQARD